MEVIGDPTGVLSELVGERAADQHPEGTGEKEHQSAGVLQGAEGRRQTDEENGSKQVHGEGVIQDEEGQFGQGRFTFWVGHQESNERTSSRCFFRLPA